MKIHNMVQLSGEWWLARWGKVTASSADRIITPTGKRSAAQDAYIAEIIAQQVTDCDPQMFTERVMSEAMRHGRDCEPEARKWYQMERGRDVRMVGGVESSCGRLWCSPDGLLGDDGVLELKCPQPKTHVSYLMKYAGLEQEPGVVHFPKEYRPQVHMHLVMTRRSYVEFVSYCPRLDPLVKLVVPDEYTLRVAEELVAFLERLEYTRRQMGLPPWPGTPGCPKSEGLEAVSVVEYGDTTE